MKIEVKNINYVWHAFFPDITLRSAGINEIVDMVESHWPKQEGMEIKWEAKDNKFVVKDVEKASGKISKSDQGRN